ncbi:MAG: NAD-dependent epimerase/dehydratase family protein [bacterium]
MNILVTGSGGLVGSETVKFYARKRLAVFGIDNNMRRCFFGEAGDVSRNIARLQKKYLNYHHFNMDIRDRMQLETLFQQHRFHRIVHCAAQPSHEKARELPLVDFEINALATMNLLEMTRKYAPEAAFVHISTNKVYGTSPNDVPLQELDTRWEYANPEDFDGITESCQIDQTTHSLFGASKLAADVTAQEYARYFGLKIGIFRAGCVAGPNQQGVELHGFLSFLIKSAISGVPFNIFGYKGKQVRDVLHSGDLVQAFEAFFNHPRSGEVYNIGGGRDNSVSILEAISLVEKIANLKIATEYHDRHRTGDHICYISNLKKFQTHFPEWNVTRSLNETVKQLVEAEFTHKHDTR